MFPPRFCINRTSLEQMAKRKSDFVANYSSLANTIMLSTTVATHSANNIASAKNTEPFIRPKQRKASLNRTGKLTAPGMDSLKESLHAEGVLKDSAALITNARRSGTNAHYESAWRKWHSWYSHRQVDPIKCSVNKILQFLTEYFNMGYEHSTIAGFRSAISAYHDSINGIPIGKEPRISVLLAGVYNIRPRQPRYTFIWDVKKVIDFLATLNSPRELNSKDLTLKLTMLLALTSATKASEIGFLDIRYLIKYSSGYTFHFGKNTKTSNRSKSRDPVKLYIFKENQSLCVCRCIDLYLERTKEIRGQNSQLLLSFVKPSGPVSTPTISR